MMKKVTYLMTLIFAVALMSTSCCKDDPIVPDGTLTEADLQGVWVSDSYSLDGVTYTSCSNLPEGEYMLITLNLNNELVGQVDDNCNGSIHLFVEASLGNEVLNLDATQGGYFLRFNVVSYDSGTETLTLQLTNKSGDSYLEDVPDNGTYVLEKQ